MTARTFSGIAVAASLTFLLASVEAMGRETRGKNQQSEDAAKWAAAAGDHFVLSLYQYSDNVVLTTDKTKTAAGSKQQVFLITKDEAAAIVQVLVDCGMWDRPDVLPEGPLPPARYLYVGDRAWRLGLCPDDVSSMVIVQHLLATSKGDRQQALKDWLSQGLGDKK